MAAPEFEPLTGYTQFTPQEMISRSAQFLQEVRHRRTVRDFSPESVPRTVIDNCLKAAGTAPSGANKQPWRFVVVSDPELKRRIRLAAEEEEKAFYQERATPEWLEALENLGTNWKKPFLEVAPYLIAIFAESYALNTAGEKVKHYYVQESVGIACGLLITALHYSGLATLTHTPSPMGFLNTLLDRPPNERPFLLLVVGLPAAGARVPKIRKKTLSEIVSFI